MRFSDGTSSRIYSAVWRSFYIFLALGIFGLHTPDEVLVAFAGYLTSAGTFLFVFTIVFTLYAVIVGTLFTYMIGRKLGKPLIHYVGNYLFLTPHHMHKIERWFINYGSWTVTFGYFVPGMSEMGIKR
ncbi:hypothetical protein CSV80_03195 [Sporosarcina sp. P12(2017)]|uniref:DedA family protein n=1 Tax=unclassified Sporosarcina TaxID=2647733 RepID=UPI000C169AB5|nr:MULTISPECIES: VTT domain-containing protein [unclassified Sporosarcina]PIC58542.1 hypothetical protein CSV81_03190 [Sporosarcina sp. P10]PIC61861.1 hypothetical protein CSV80_03195 [Sporosarcina sp. P12(2017)]